MFYKSLDRKIKLRHNNVYLLFTILLEVEVLEQVPSSINSFINPYMTCCLFLINFEFLNILSCYDNQSIFGVFCNNNNNVCYEMKNKF